MPNLPGSAPIELHPPLAKLDPFVVATGQPIPPIERVALFIVDQWEDFINEWANRVSGYAKVERARPARTVRAAMLIGIVKDKIAIRDNYQCKHYDKPLTPTNVLMEMRKLSYYTMVSVESHFPESTGSCSAKGCGNRAHSGSLGPLFRSRNCSRHRPRLARTT